MVTIGVAVVERRRPASRHLLKLLLLTCACVTGISVIAITTWIWQGPPSVPQPEQLGQLEPAVGQLVKKHLAIAQSHPTSAHAHGELGLVYEANKLWPEAEQAFSNAVQLAPGDWHWLLHQAIVSRQMGDIDESLRMLRSVVIVAPQHAAVQQRFGEALLQTGDGQGAEQAFRRVTELEADSPEGYVGLGRVHISQAQTEEALRWLEHAVKLDPSYKVARYLLGTVYRTLGREQDAMRELALGAGGTIRYLPDPLTPQLEEFSVNNRARMRQGIHLLAGNQPEEASDVFRSLLESDARNVTAMNNLAGAYAQLGRFDEAFELLQRALNADPNKYTTHINLASWALKRGKLDEALAYAESAVDRAPWSKQSRTIHVKVLLRLGRFREAANSLEHAIHENPYDYDFILTSGQVYIQLSQFDKAKSRLQRAITYSDSDTRAYLLLCQTHIQLGELEEAQRVLRHVPEQSLLNPQDKQFAQMLSNTLAKQKGR